MRLKYYNIFLNSTRIEIQILSFLINSNGGDGVGELLLLSKGNLKSLVMDHKLLRLLPVVPNPTSADLEDGKMNLQSFSFVSCLNLPTIILCNYAGINQNNVISGDRSDEVKKPQ